MHPLTEDLAGRITRGSILDAPYWPEPVRVLTTHVRDDRIEVMTTTSSGTIIHRGRLIATSLVTSRRRKKPSLSSSR